MASDEEHLLRLTSDVHIAVLATTRPDRSIHASLVSSGAMEHPLRSGLAVAAVVAGGARKLGHLRSSGRAAATFVNGFDWVTAEGPVTIIGPDDPSDGFAAADVPMLLRRVFQAAAGSHDDWDEYDRVMAEQRRAALFIHPERILRNR